MTPATCSSCGIALNHPDESCPNPACDRSDLSQDYKAELGRRFTPIKAEPLGHVIAILDGRILGEPEIEIDPETAAKVTKPALWRPAAELGIPHRLPRERLHQPLWDKLALMKDDGTIQVVSAQLAAWFHKLTDTEVLRTIGDGRWDEEALQLARDERDRRGLSGATGDVGHATMCEVLLLAADYLEHFGWKRLGYGELGGAASLVGAVIICATSTRQSVAAREVLAAHLGIPRYDVSIWNDADERTAAEVVAALRGAGGAKYARLRRRLQRWRGDARVYDLTEPLEGHSVVIVSAVQRDRDSVPETFTFPASEDSLEFESRVAGGEILSASFIGALNHVRALRMAGYTVCEGEQDV